MLHKPDPTPKRHHRRVETSSIHRDKHSINQRPSSHQSAYNYASGQSQKRLSLDPNDRNESENERNALLKEKYSTIQSLIGHPICCGYLLQYCQVGFMCLA
jgi:hypothetical protein